MVAGRTKNIRIGTAVVVLPLHNPIMVAEEAAMIDNMSGGRLNLGIGVEPAISTLGREG